MTKETQTMSKYQLKKLIKKLEDIRGRNTELVSLYIPAGYDMSKISDFVTSEASEAENIKSKHTRKNVQAALDKIGRKVKEEQETPENGVAFFAGNVSEREGRPDVQVWEVVPPQPIESRHYRCDKEFVLEPLREMVVSDKVYGLIALDKNEAAIGYLQGSSIKTEYTMSSEVPGKTRAGGQCLDPDTLVQKSDGEICRIEDIETGDRVKAADFESMELMDSVVQDRWEEEKQVYRVETKHPSMSIVASGDHEVFTADRGIRKARVEDLNEGETLVFPEKVTTASEEEIIPSEKYFNSYRISENGREKLRRERERIGLSQKELGERSGCTQTAISKIELGERDTRRNQLEKICQALELDFLNFVREHCAGKNFRLPRRIDPELAKVLGYFAGDGSFDPERLNFHEQDREVAESYRQLIEEKFDCDAKIRFREEKNYYLLRAFGKPLVNYLKGEFPELRKSGDTTIPRRILRAGDDVLCGFLKGLYDAEGHASGVRKRIGLSANNRLLMKQLQSALLRNGVVSSLTEYDNSDNPYSDNTKYTASISDIRSVENFAEKIGFTAERKKQEVRKILDRGKQKVKNRQVLASGNEVRNQLEDHGYTMEDFKSTNTFLQGERAISKKAFRKNFLEDGDRKLEEELEEKLGSELLPARIKSIEKMDERRVIDISIEAGNFVANNLVVHNSAQRFARIRKEMLKNFMQEIAENSKKAFLDKARDDKLLGILIGGPGWVKEKFLDNHLHQELQEKVVATEDLNYSGEEALEELVSKAEDAIQDAEVVHEKNLVNEFFDNLREENGKSEYGLEPVKKALEMGAVDTLLITEDVNLFAAKYRCENGHEETVFEERPEIDDTHECPECGEEMELEEISDIVDEFGKRAEEMDSDLEIISTDHEEGRRLDNLGGVAAIMRYRIR
ncbi:MAG: LAGLIDADG family homing endonuclease [Candidatus Nanohaloarchaea archaeon]